MKKKKRGFTLVEILVAIVLIGVGMIALVGVLPTALRQIRKVDSYIRARMGAQKIMEYFNSASYYQLYMWALNPDTLDLDEALGDTPLPRGSEKRATITDISGGNYDLLKITVEITWTDNMLRNNSYRLVNYRYRGMRY